MVGLYCLVIFFSLLPCCPAQANQTELRRLERVVAEGIAAGKCPGAVIMFGRGNKVLYQKAFGLRALEPQREPMTVDTIFDLASVTKPVATALSVMILQERGKLALDQSVSRYLPEFTGQGKDQITVRQLLLHRGGLTPDNHLRDYRDGPAIAWKRICALPLRWPVGERFKYTDVGFIVLGKVVERISGKSLAKFTQANIFRPLQMNTTGFNPPPTRHGKIAPTQKLKNQVLRGKVHDPRARLLGGVAGHAGLFATAADLSRLCRMLIGGGMIAGTRVLNARTVTLMTTLPTKGQTSGRGLGWDLTSAYSSPRGHWLSKGISFGHSGFTGTSIWIDPATRIWTIFLSSRCHPAGKGNVIALRRKVATCVGRALGLHQQGAQPGIEVLACTNFHQLKGARVGLITNHTGRTRDGFSTIELFNHTPGLKLKALFSPEHGLQGILERKIAHSQHSGTKCKVWSLYGKTRRPTPEMLAGIDTLVFDIQDIGARFYTYISTMLNCLEAASTHKLRFVVLDRPNPIGGHRVFGPLPDKDMLSFTACARIPLVHGMTVGELARLFKLRQGLQCQLEVVKVKGWQRNQWLDQTNTPWVNPSPNMRSIRAAALYPSVCLLEATNISMGRGTKRPFELFGAPWINGKKLATALNQAACGGVEFAPLQFTPDTSKFKGQKCGGVELKILAREKIHPLRLGITLIQTIHQCFGDKFKISKVNHLLRNKGVFEQIAAGDKIEKIINGWAKDMQAFMTQRQQVLLYK